MLEIWKAFIHLKSCKLILPEALFEEFYIFLLLRYSAEYLSLWLDVLEQ